MKLISYKITAKQLLMMVLCFLSVCFATKAQTGIVKGRILDEEGKSLPFASVYLKEIVGKEGGRSTLTDTLGRYGINGLESGQYEVIISRIGYRVQKKSVELLSGQVLNLDFVMKEQMNELEPVEVIGKSSAKELMETGYAVNVIETEEYKNFTTDINQVLTTTSGIHIREAGGLGSGFKLSLNGLSGNQIRYFIDGIPMENFGSALTLNNYPVNLIDKIEVYKGVVPVSLGSDALGGAVNITTAFRRKSFLDLSYSYGSFNTHKASINSQYANNQKGYFIKLSSFFNHSDNNYRMDSVPLIDLDLGNHLGTIETTRFHNEYTSGMVHAEAGVLDKKYADQWSLGITSAYNRKNYQHPDNNTNIVFGNFHTRNKTLLASTNYKKYFKRFTVKAYILGGRIVESIVDTSSLKYNWAGDYIMRSPTDPNGELFERRSLLTLTDVVFRSNIGTDYEISENHEFSLNLTQNYLNRTGEDQVNTFNRSFESPNFIHKNFLGFAYTFKTDTEELEASVFAKQYWYNGKIITQDYEDNDIITQPGFSNTGHGGVFTWHIAKSLQVKSSYEQTFRIPESYEILGDGIYIQPNPELKPEKSYNANLGIWYEKRFKLFQLKSETNCFYRSSSDFIRYNPLGPFGKYENLNNVRTTGLEGSLNVNYNDFVMLRTNITWQNLRDQTEFDEGLPNTNYKSRVPNVPYLFGNVRCGFRPFGKSASKKFIIYWNTRYVHEFFLTWENLGNAGSKNVIPRQFTHDLQVEYAIKEGRYNFSLSVNNITDARVYDNFNIQKPGRAMYVKFGYFLN